MFAYLHDFEAPVGGGAPEEAAFAFVDAEGAFAGGDSVPAGAFGLLDFKCSHGSVAGGIIPRE